jgi:hypothetical protein
MLADARISHTFDALTVNIFMFLSHFYAEWTVLFNCVGVFAFSSISHVIVAEVSLAKRVLMFSACAPRVCSISLSSCASAETCSWAPLLWCCKLQQHLYNMRARRPFGLPSRKGIIFCCVVQLSAAAFERVRYGLKSKTSYALQASSCFSNDI